MTIKQRELIRLEKRYKFYYDEFKFYEGFLSNINHLSELLIDIYKKENIRFLELKLSKFKDKYNKWYKRYLRVSDWSE